MYKQRDLVFGSIIFVFLVILVAYIITPSKSISAITKNIYTSNFENIPPYITQSLYINIYSTPEDYPNYQFLFKGTLHKNIMIRKGSAFVLVPKTAVSIPIRVFNNAPKTKFSIEANGIEQEILECDFIATIF
jgi:hypothetical protein